MTPDPKHYTPPNPGHCRHCRHEDVLLTTHTGPCPRCTGLLPDSELHARIVAVPVAGTTA